MAGADLQALAASAVLCAARRRTGATPGLGFPLGGEYERMTENVGRAAEEHDGGEEAIPTPAERLSPVEVVGKCSEAEGEGGVGGEAAKRVGEAETADFDMASEREGASERDSEPVASTEVGDSDGSPFERPFEDDEAAEDEGARVVKEGDGGVVPGEDGERRPVPVGGGFLRALSGFSRSLVEPTSLGPMRKRRRRYVAAAPHNQQQQQPSSDTRRQQPASDSNSASEEEEEEDEGIVLEVTNVGSQGVDADILGRGDGADALAPDTMAVAGEDRVTIAPSPPPAPPTPIVGPPVWLEGLRVRACDWRQALFSAPPPASMREPLAAVSGCNSGGGSGGAAVPNHSALRVLPAVTEAIGRVAAAVPKSFLPLSMRRAAERVVDASRQVRGPSSQDGSGSPPSLGAAPPGSPTGDRCEGTAVAVERDSRHLERLLVSLGVIEPVRELLDEGAAEGDEDRSLADAAGRGASAGGVAGDLPVEGLGGTGTGASDASADGREMSRRSPDEPEDGDDEEEGGTAACLPCRLLLTGGCAAAEDGDRSAGSGSGYGSRSGFGAGLSGPCLAVVLRLLDGAQVCDWI